MFKQHQHQMFTFWGPGVNPTGSGELGTVENHGKNGKKHGKLLRKSQKSRQNHDKDTASNHGPEESIKLKI